MSTAGEQHHTKEEIDAVEDDLFTEAYAPLDGMNVDEVVVEGRAAATENDMTLEDLGGILEEEVIDQAIPD